MSFLPTQFHFLPHRNALLDGIDTVLVAWRPGEQGGVAVAEILSGKAEPSGRLAQGWPQNVGQVRKAIRDGSPFFGTYLDLCQIFRRIDRLNNFSLQCWMACSVYSFSSSCPKTVSRTREVFPTGSTTLLRLQLSRTRDCAHRSRHVGLL